MSESEARPRPGGELGRKNDLHAPARESRVNGVRRRRHGRRGRTGHQLAMRQDAQIVQVVPVRVRQFGGDRVDAQEEQACDDDGHAGQPYCFGPARAEAGQDEREDGEVADRQEPHEVHVPVWKSKFYGAFVLNRRVVLHAIDAPPARWRGDAGSSPLD